MSRAVSFTILGGLVLAAIAAIHVNGVNAREETKFIPISVLSKKQANYGTDENLGTIPAVSIDILEDKVRDTQWESSSVRIIKYTSLPVENKGLEDEDDAQSADQGEPHNNQENNGNENGGSNPPGGGNSNQNTNNNGNGNSNQNMNNNGNGNSGDGNSSSNNGKEKEKEKETQPENKSTAPDKPDKNK